MFSIQLYVSKTLLDVLNDFDHDGDLFGSFGCLPLAWVSKRRGCKTTWFLLRLSLEIGNYKGLYINQPGFHFEQSSGGCKIHLWWSHSECWLKRGSVGWSSVKDSVTRRILDGENMGMESFKKGVDPAWMEFVFFMYPLLFNKPRCFWHCSFAENWKQPTFCGKNLFGGT